MISTGVIMDSPGDDLLLYLGNVGIVDISARCEWVRGGVGKEYVVILSEEWRLRTKIRRVRAGKFYYVSRATRCSSLT